MTQFDTECANNGDDICVDLSAQESNGSINRGGTSDNEFYVE